jgi:hypothetical protein
MIRIWTHQDGHLPEGLAREVRGELVLARVQIDEDELEGDALLREGHEDGSRPADEGAQAVEC